jgi:hypothetical protein
MREFQYSLFSLLIAVTVAAIWLPLFMMRQPGAIVVGFVLCGIMLAVHQLLKERKYAWAISALLAGIIAWSSIVIVALIANYG